MVCIGRVLDRKTRFKNWREFDEPPLVGSAVKRENDLVALFLEIMLKQYMDNRIAKRLPTDTLIIRGTFNYHVECGMRELATIFIDINADKLQRKEASHAGVFVQYLHSGSICKYHSLTAFAYKLFDSKKIDKKTPKLFPILHPKDSTVTNLGDQLQSSISTNLRPSGDASRPNGLGLEDSGRLCPSKRPVEPSFNSGNAPAVLPPTKRARLNDLQAIVTDDASQSPDLASPSSMASPSNPSTSTATAATTSELMVMSNSQNTSDSIADSAPFAPTVLSASNSLTAPVLSGERVQEIEYCFSNDHLEQLSQLIVKGLNACPVQRDPSPSTTDINLKTRLAELDVENKKLRSELDSARQQHQQVHLEHAAAMAQLQEAPKLANIVKQALASHNDCTLLKTENAQLLARLDAATQVNRELQLTNESLRGQSQVAEQIQSLLATQRQATPTEAHLSLPVMETLQSISQHFSAYTNISVQLQSLHQSSPAYRSESSSKPQLDILNSLSVADQLSLLRLTIGNDATFAESFQSVLALRNIHQTFEFINDSIEQLKTVSEMLFSPDSQSRFLELVSKVQECTASAVKAGEGVQMTAQQVQQLIQYWLPVISAPMQTTSTTTTATSASELTGNYQPAVLPHTSLAVPPAATATMVSSAPMQTTTATSASELTGHYQPAVLQQTPLAVPPAATPNTASPSMDNNPFDHLPAVDGHHQHMDGTHLQNFFTEFLDTTSSIFAGANDVRHSHP